MGVEGEVTALIDFGDSLAAPLIQDLAVCAAYHFDAEADDPFTDARLLTAAYEAILPLTDQERDLIPILIVGRAVMTVLITAWRSRLHPDNADYILRNAGRSIAALNRLVGAPA
jgi:Ser/Thr protein kinase RdoA (MazF antagonist)